MKVKPLTSRGRVLVELDRTDDELLAKGDKAGDSRRPVKLTSILVPTDFSACSLKALRYAAAFAAQFSAKVTLLHVMPQLYGSAESCFMELPLPGQETRGEVRERLAGLAKSELGRATPVTPLVRSGQPAAGIVSAAGETAADLIIIATHGHTGLKHVLLGSTTENVVRRASCPVLVVREEEHEFVTT